MNKKSLRKLENDLGVAVETKNGDKAKQAQINFVNDHEEYKEAFEAFYS